MNAEDVLDVNVVIVPTSVRVQMFFGTAEWTDIEHMLLNAIDIAWYDDDSIIESIVENDIRTGFADDRDDAFARYVELGIIVRADLHASMDSIREMMEWTEVYGAEVRYNPRYWTVRVGEDIDDGRFH